MSHCIHLSIRTYIPCPQDLLQGLCPEAFRIDSSYVRPVFIVRCRAASLSAGSYRSYFLTHWSMLSVLDTSATPPKYSTALDRAAKKDSIFLDGIAMAKLIIENGSIQTRTAAFIHSPVSVSVTRRGSPAKSNCISYIKR